MIHELSHIMTRFHPELREHLYAAIGFHPLPFDSPWASQDALVSRFLTNPDGEGYDYSITLHTRAGEEVEAMPVIRSNYPDYNPKTPNFFNYVGFQIFPVIQQDGQLMFGVKPDGNSLYAISDYTDFFTQIKDNTDYIIHPDEIIADNFMILLLSHNKKEGFSPQQYSIEGQALLQEISKIIGEYEPEKK